MKLIIRDYIAAFYPAKVKEQYKSGGWWLFLYFLTIVPAMAGFFEKKEYTLMYYLVCLPILYCMFSAPLHPMRPPKMMFLCPMNSNMRKEYAKKYSRLCITVPVIFSIIGVVALMLLGLCDWLCATGIVFNCMILSLICCGINSNGFGQRDKNGARSFDVSTKQGLWEMAGIFICIFASVDYAMIMPWNTPVSMKIKLIPFIIISAIEIPFLKKFIYYRKETIEHVVKYESAYR